MSGFRDQSAAVVYNNADVVLKFSEVFKDDLVKIAEKERSYRFLNESFSDLFADLQTTQFEKAGEEVNLFIQALTQVELSRKLMYQRFHNLSKTSFVRSIDLAKQLKTLLKDRDDIAKKYDSHRGDNRLSIKVGSLNMQAIQSVGNFANQYHDDLRDTFITFAYSQMELHARSLERWSQFITQIGQIDTEQDIVYIKNELNIAPEVKNQPPV